MRRNLKVAAVLLIILVVLAIVGYKIWQAKTQKVSVADRVCSLDSDCTVVPTDCMGCSCGEPVNKKFERKYLDLNISECKNYHGPVCESACAKPYVKCVNKVCTRTAER